jgi:hypothetical protein
MDRIKKDQIDYIRGLWKCLSQITAPLVRERRLRTLCDRVAKVSDPLLLTSKQRNKIILSLKNRLKRQNEVYKRSKEILLHSLSAREREKVRKECPFRKERDDLIRLLRKKGVSYALLSKVSGLGKTSIYNILTNKKEIGR